MEPNHHGESNRIWSVTFQGRHWVCSRTCQEFVCSPMSLGLKKTTAHEKTWKVMSRYIHIYIRTYTYDYNILDVLYYRLRRHPGSNYHQNPQSFPSLIWVKYQMGLETLGQKRLKPHGKISIFNVERMARLEYYGILHPFVWWFITCQNLETHVAWITVTSNNSRFFGAPSFEFWQSPWS